MAKCYNKRILSDALADLGNTLGRVPKQKDLTPDMASRNTYLRYFGNWKTALEYAGFVEGSMPEGHDKHSAKDSCDVVTKTSGINLVNLCGKPIVFLDGNGESDVLPSSGTASVRFNNPVQPAAAKDLSSVINDVPIVVSRLRGIVIFSDDGSEYKFPSPAKNTFYIVPEVVARNIHSFGRSPLDLLYPRRKHMANDIMYVETLGMVYTKKLPICT